MSYRKIIVDGAELVGFFSRGRFEERFLRICFSHRLNHLFGFILIDSMTDGIFPARDPVRIPQAAPLRTFSDLEVNEKDEANKAMPAALESRAKSALGFTIVEIPDRTLVANAATQKRMENELQQLCERNANISREIF